MLRKFLSLLILVAATPVFLFAQECKLRFSVVYNSGESMQVGLTPDQKKMWDHDGSKKFKGMCLDPKQPDFIILWSAGLNGAELVKASLDHFNVVRSTGEAPTTSSAERSPNSTTLTIRPSNQVREKANYIILDASKTPYALIRKGEGYQDVPQGRRNAPGETLHSADLASTIADPSAALENALKWLKKEKKL